jgi:hypothetical protein
MAQKDSPYACNYPVKPKNNNIANMSSKNSESSKYKKRIASRHDTTNKFRNNYLGVVLHF